MDMIKIQELYGSNLDHHGDCNFWHSDICTCGLFHFLSSLTTSEDDNTINKNYPTFLEEFWNHEDLIKKIKV